MATGASRPLDGTVVIPTRNRPESLQRCLEALDQQDARIVLEVVVVDDASTTPLDVSSLQSSWPLRVLRGPGHGPATARNLGIAAARAPVVLFTDDDTIPAPGWAAAALEVLAGDERTVGVEGPVSTPPYDPLFSYSIAAKGGGFYWTCNVAYRRSVLREIDGFDAQTFPRYREDRDLAFRALSIGPIGYSAGMSVVHTPRPIGARWTFESNRAASADAVLARRHPDQFAWDNAVPLRLQPVIGAARAAAALYRTEREQPCTTGRRRLRAAWFGVLTIAGAVAAVTVQWRAADRTELDAGLPAVQPRVLLITEAAVAPEASGASKTLHTLFSTYPGPLRIVTLSAPNGAKDALDRIVLPRRILPERLNALGHLISRGRRRLDLQLISRLPRLRSAVRRFQPDLIVVCPLGDWASAVAASAVRIAAVPTVVYLMDDWQEALPDRRTDDLLRRSEQWLMISEELRDTTAVRVGAASETMIVHNPARVTDRRRSDLASGGGGTRASVIYAGSIWGMHVDAVALTAEAVAGLRADGADIEMIVHTTPSFWAANAELFTRFGVVDGGLVSATELPDRLLAADLGLLACSFEPDQAAMSRASVQTKLTEYMAAGLPILGVGPGEAASLRFVDRWQAGQSCTEPTAEAVAATIERMLGDPERLRATATASRANVAEHFGADEVRSRLWAFLASDHVARGPRRKP